MSTITVHDGQGKNPTVLTETQYNELKATGMLWEFHPDAPLQWPTTPDQPATVDQIAQECAKEISLLPDSLRARQDHVASIIAAAIREATEQLAKAGAGWSIRAGMAEQELTRLQMELDATVCAEQHRQVVAERDGLKARNQRLLSACKESLKLQRTANDVAEKMVAERDQLRAALSEAEGAGKNLAAELCQWCPHEVRGPVLTQWDQALARIAATRTRKEAKS